jgi:hypothetical protein
MKKVVNFLGVCAIVALCGMVAILFTTCKKDAAVKKEIFSGYAQKGPFVVGSSVTIVELDANLDQTGKTYFTTISDNLGSFEQKNIELVSNYVELKADGSYFNETTGAVFAITTLYALVDISDVNSANVNVLTHLEKPRVEYLIKQGKSFADAKQQAQKEVLAIFGFTPSNTSSEALALTNDGMLLAISSILAGIPYYGLMDMGELMANIAADIKTDGKLDNTALGTKLISCAYGICANNTSLSLDRIRENMKSRYAEFGLNVTIPDFESYIQAFANSNLYPRTEVN